MNRMRKHPRFGGVLWTRRSTPAIRPKRLPMLWSSTATEILNLSGVQRLVLRTRQRLGTRSARLSRGLRPGPPLRSGASWPGSLADSLRRTRRLAEDRSQTRSGPLPLRIAIAPDRSQSLAPDPEEPRGLTPSGPGRSVLSFHYHMRKHLRGSPVVTAHKCVVIHG